MQIKFRVWCKDFREWEKDTIFLNQNGVPIHYSNDKGLRIIRPDSHIVQFWTGLKDDDGTEIYEGDIIRETWEENNPYGHSPDRIDAEETIYTVEYKAPSFIFKSPKEHAQRCIENLKRKVIGNCFEQTNQVSKNSPNQAAV